MYTPGVAAATMVQRQRHAVDADTVSAGSEARGDWVATNVTQVDLDPVVRGNSDMSGGFERLDRRTEAGGTER